MQKLIAALLSGVLLFCSFPPLEYSVFVWIALIPLIYLCFSCKPGASFLYGLLAGAVFWLGTIFWLTRVSFIGWFFVSLYCAFYLALFALVVSWWLARRRSQSSVKSGGQLADLSILFGVPALWVGLEYARSIFLTGFPWNLLGVSQYTWHPLIQCADVGGVYLVSYLIIMGNTAFALLIRAFLNERINPEQVLSEVDGQVRHCGRVEGMIYHRREGILKPAIGLVSFLLILFMALEYGKWRLAQSSEKLETIQAAAIQPNVPQQLKWSEEWADDICRRLKKSTAETCKTAPPDLIVWPETALPDFVRSSAPSRNLVNDSRRYGVPLLVGSMDMEELSDKTNYFNSSFLFLQGQGKPQVYAKRHLVLFGEYVPLANYFPFLRSISGVEEDFMPGRTNVVFQLNGGGQKFSVLICFEDTLPYLARECVRAGARLLINQTNDAWFDPSWASRQHMTHCVFRCIENRVACLRSTNTGLTCLIDRFGLIRSSLPPLGRKSREPQVMRSEAEFSPEKMPLTFYTRHGDIFALACSAFSLPLLIGLLLNLHKKAVNISPPAK